jgi:hypothetical protein
VRQSLAVLAATGAALAALRQQACASVEQAMRGGADLLDDQATQASSPR